MSSIAFACTVLPVWRRRGGGLLSGSGSRMPFTPRPVFPFPTRAPTWYIGHMVRAMRKIRENMANVDLVLELRDARIPLTSINPAFEELFGTDRGLLPKNGKKRLVVYNRRDLAEPGLETPLQRALLQHAGQLSLFTNTRSDEDIRRLLKIALKLTEAEVASKPEHEQSLRILIVGMPNVGKSSMLNALRRVGVNRGKAAQTGSTAGVTRKLTGTVRVWDKPPTYVYDTPGIMIPYFGEGDEAAEKGMKLALTSGMKESLYDTHTLADYLLFKLNLRYFYPGFQTSPQDLPSFLQPYVPILPTNDIGLLIQAIGRRTGALMPGGIVDEEAAARTLIMAFRDGKLGLWALDDMGLLFRGNSNTALLPGPDDTASPLPQLPGPSDKQLEQPSGQLAPQEVDDSMALIQSFGSVPSIIEPDSPTSKQISTFVSAFLEVQRNSLTELSMSKNQVKKRELQTKADERKRKWVVRHPHLVKTASKIARGVGIAKGASRPFYVGGDSTRIRLEKRRIIARKVTKNRAKRK